jgi:hypothetical protein
VVSSREGCIEGCREDRGWKGVIRMSKGGEFSIMGM